MACKRWIVGQDRTELVDADGRVITSLPRWSRVEKNAVGLSMLRTSPRHANEPISRAEIQEYSSTESHVRKIGRVLSLVGRSRQS